MVTLFKNILEASISGKRERDCQQPTPTSPVAAKTMKFFEVDTNLRQPYCYGGYGGSVYL